MPNTASDEDRVLTLIDELYEALDKNEGTGGVARKIAERITDERDAELGRIVSYLNEQGAPITAALLETKAHRR